MQGLIIVLGVFLFMWLLVKLLNTSKNDRV